MNEHVEAEHSITENTNGRHPSITSITKFLVPNARLASPQYTIAVTIADLADDILLTIPQDSPELTAGLRKLLEAKDCFVRASLDLNPVDYRDR